MDSSGNDAPAQKFISDYNELHVDFITDEWGDQWEGNDYDSVMSTGFLVKYELLQGKTAMNVYFGGLFDFSFFFYFFSTRMHI